MTVAERASALADLLPRPLDPVRSVKLKISILLIASGGAGVLYLWLQYRWLPPVMIILVTFAIVLLTAQILAHGMTRPLRAMTAAARAMAQGDYSRRVRASSRDEVGQLAVAFNQMAADLAAADRQRRELIANVSHELRTPIAALQAVLENLVDGVGSEPATLATALSQTQRLGRLVAELLDLSRIDAGVVALSPEDVVVAELLADTVAEAEVASRVAGRRALFTVDVAPPELVAHVDPGRLHQVLVNLLDNAARHGPPGGLVTVVARAEGEKLVLEISDEGPGIAPEDRDRVFHRFTRGERAAGGGTGLGLAIARWAVELHGGRIAVAEPRPRSGASTSLDADGRAGRLRPTSASPRTRGCRIRITLPGAVA
jgi:signal transduction histidine kinase